MPRPTRYRITRIIEGDPWDAEASSPLCRRPQCPGGRYGFSRSMGALVGATSPGELLVNQAGARGAADDRRRRWQRTAQRDGEDAAATDAARYRDWVEANRARGPREHRRPGWLCPYSRYGYRGLRRVPSRLPGGGDREGLIVDVRFNGGGNVSQLLLEKLARRRLGYAIQRWGSLAPYR